MQAFFSFDNVVQQLLSFLSLKQFGINVLDLIIIAVVLFYSYEGYVVGFTLAALDFASFIASFLIGLIFFESLSPHLVAFFSLPQGFANAISFFLIALVSEIALAFLLRRGLLLLPELSGKFVLTKLLRKIDHPLGILPGLASAYVILSFLLTVIITLPSSPVLKQLVTTSRLGSSLVSHTASIQDSLHDVFGGAVQDTLNVLTIKPQSDETVNLRFTVAEPTVDEEAEAQMVRLVNRERVKQGLPELSVDPKLLTLARAYSKDMLQRGYFSHYNPEGMSPFDRMTVSGILFVHAGENLALAPSTNLAHQGLMNSSGHRANILSPNYHKVGIGVMDGGIYGKMFVQEFTD